MAVYTEITAEELHAVLSRYDVGALSSFKGIAEGVENSNYFLGTTKGQFILTLYEKRVARGDLPFFLGLMEHLAARGITCPTPLHDSSGSVLQEIQGRPAAIVTFLPGYSLKRPYPVHCEALGMSLARLHNAGADFALKRQNALSVAGWRDLAHTLSDMPDKLVQGSVDAIKAEVSVLEAEWSAHLPAGVIHADLFPDNVFFIGNEVSGLIDFYFACNDLFAYDLAICLNSWCFEPDHAFNVTKAKALFAGYNSVRPLSEEEINALPLLARGSALRFLLTRLHDWFHTPDTAFVRRKDPLEYWRKLRFHQSITSPGAYGL